MGKTDLIARLAADATKFKSGMKDAEDANKKFAKSSEEAKDSADGLQGRVDKVGAKLMEVAASWAKYATAGAAASAAMKVATDAFKRSETNMDAWESAMQQATAAYNTFLDTIVSGNWDNFFSNLNIAISGAKELYDALDRLGSTKANNAAAIALTQKQIADLRLEKQTSTDASRIKKIDDELKVASARLSALYAQGVDAQKAAALRMAATTIQTRYNAEGRQLDYASAERIASLMMKGGQGFFDQQAKKYAALTAKGQVEKVSMSGYMPGSASYSTHMGFDLQSLSDSYQKQYIVSKVVTEAEADLAHAISMYAGAINDSARAAQEQYKNQSYAFRNGMAMRGMAGGAGAVSALTLGTDRTAGTSTGMVGELLISQMRPTDGAVEHFRKWFEENPPKPIEVPIEVPLENMKTVADGIAASFNAASGALGNFASQSREAAIAAKSFTIAGAIATLVGQFASIPKGAEIWSWSAGTIAGTGTLVATIASLKNAASYSEGGRIRGRHATGDMVPIMANAGEVVLNASQQRNVAAQLVGGGGGTVEFTLNGDKLVGVINNYGRGMGLGKMVFQP